MLEGSSGYSKGILVNGNIKKKEATTYTPGVNDITLSKGQYLNGNQVIKGEPNLKPENIKSGVSIFGIHGSIKDNSGKTLEATNVANDASYTYLNIPEEAIYNTSSVIKVANNELSNIQKIQKVYDSYDSAGNQSGKHSSCKYTVSTKGTYLVISQVGIRSYVSNLNLNVSHNGSSMALETKHILTGYSEIKMSYGIVNCNASDIIQASSVGGNPSGDDAHFVQLLIYRI